MKFTPTGRADKDLADLAKLIEDSQWQGDGAAQQAIWCLTDNADIQWLMSENQDKERKLREFVAAVKKIDLSKLPRIKRTTVVYSEVGQLHKTAKLDIDTIDYRGGERGREIRNTLKNREVGDEKDKIASDGGAVGKQIDAAIQKKKAQDEKEYQAQKAMESWSLNEIKGSIEVVIKEPARIKIQLIRPDGTLLKEVYDSKDVVAGKAKFPYKHKDYNLPIGKYLIRVLGNNKIVKEEEYILK
jgi:hypothetical protein